MSHSLRYARNRNANNNSESFCDYEFKCNWTPMTCFLSTVKFFSFINLSFVIIFFSANIENYKLTGIDAPINYIETSYTDFNPYLYQLTNNVITNNNTVDGYNVNYFYSDNCMENILYSNYTFINDFTTLYKYDEVNMGFPDIYFKPKQKCLIDNENVPTRRNNLAFYSAQITYILSIILLVVILAFLCIVQYNKYRENQ